MGRITCAACGTVQEVASEPAHCVICAALLGATEEAARGHAPADVSVPSSSTANVFDVAGAPEAGGQLLQAEPGRRPAELDEILAAEKRTTTALSLVPLWGIWRIWRSDVHAVIEKTLLSVLSITLTVGLVLVGWRLLPGEADRAAAAKARVVADLGVLAKLVERYRGQQASLPEAGIWQDSVRRRDPRFFDPWGEPYRYEKRQRGFSIGTYGRDAEPGGSGADEDVFREFPH